MKILFLTYDLPFPLITGGKIRSFYLLKSLSKEHQISLFSFYRDEKQRRFLPDLKPYCHKIELFKRRGPGNWQNFFFSLFRLLPFTAALYFSPQLKAALIKELKQGDYDLVHFESFYPAVFLPLVQKMRIKTLMGNENIEYRVYQRYADSRRFFLWRWLLRAEVNRMRFFEENLWRRARANLAPSVKDAAVIEKVTKKPCFIIPNGVAWTTFKKSRDYRRGERLIFIGTLKYRANQDAVKFFLQKIYPTIKGAIKEVKFILVSWYRPDWLDRYLRLDKTIELIEDKETPVAQLLEKGDILVAPIRIASGTNIKVLEAMAAGLPVATTSAGIEGIKVKKGKEALVFDRPNEFSQGVIKLLKKEELRRRLGHAGRLLVKRLYDWDKIGEDLIRIYKEIADEKAT